MTAAEQNREQLRRVSEACTMIIGNGGFLTKTDMDEWNRLRSLLGVDWDATNSCWIGYTS